MDFFAVRKMTTILVVAGTMVLSACSATQVIDNTVDVAAGATRVVAHGAVGAGRLAVRGGQAVFGANEE